MAIPGRHHRHRHPGWVVLQTAAGFAACGSRRRNYPAWDTQESARPPSKSVTATSLSCRWRCANMCSARPRWIRTCFPGHTARRPDYRRQENLRPGRGNTAAAGGGPARNTRGAAGSKSTTGHAGRRRAACAVVGGNIRPGGGLSAHSATRCSAAARPARPPAPPRPPAVIDGGRPQAAPSSFGGKATKPVPSVAVASTIRVPVVTSLRTGSCTSSRIWQPRRRPRSGRTCFRLKRADRSAAVSRSCPAAAAVSIAAIGFGRRRRSGRASCPCRPSPGPKLY